jgi:hypothetical protein
VLQLYILKVIITLSLVQCLLTIHESKHLIDIGVDTVDVNFRRKYKLMKLVRGEI